MFIFQQVYASSASSPTQAVSFSKLKEAAPGISLPAFIEASIESFAKKMGTDRNTMLAFSLVSAGVTADELKHLKNAKWGPEDQKILARQVSEISSSAFARSLSVPTATAMMGAGMPTKESDVQAFVASHIDFMAVSFLMKFRAAGAEGKALHAKDIEHAAFSADSGRASFQMCLANAGCFAIDLLRMKDDPGKISKVAGLIENGKMDRAHVTEMFGKNAWENLQTIASALVGAYAKYIASKLQETSTAFVQYVQNKETLDSKQKNDSKEQNAKAKDIADGFGNSRRGFV